LARFYRKPVAKQTDRQRFALSVAQWEALQAAMDQPLKARPKLRKLLSKPGVLG
jgi:uncharacterized protein (DUF1778 family)